MNDTMTQAYIEAVYFTETGEVEQPSADAALTPLFKVQAWQACRNFLRAASPYHLGLDLTQLGHDLWLTRVGAGVGFWGRPEVYNEFYADLFTRLAQAQGEHDAEFLE